MSPAGKLKEPQLVGLTREGRSVFLFPSQQPRPRNAEQIYLSDKFCRANLIGGTIVTYADGYRFNMEEGRGEVAKVLLGNGGLAIKTADGNAALLCGMLDIITITERNGVFYLDVPGIGCYAVAPKGVEIARKETKEEALAASRELLRNGGGEACGDKSPKAAGPATVMEKFRTTDFFGGTLVEYKDGYGFGIEFSRGKVTGFSIEGTHLLIKSDGRAKLGYFDVNQLNIEEKGGVFLISGAYCACYALAPAGVEIPKKPAWKDLEDAGEVLAGRRE